MSGGVSGYAAVSARVRVKYANLIDSAKMRDLAETPDVAAFSESLKSTFYATILSARGEGGIGAADLAQGFRRLMASEAASVIRATPGSARRIVEKLHRRHEVNNLKAVLRGIAAARSEDGPTGTWARIEPLLFPSADHYSLPLMAMAESGGIQAAVELLRGSPYHEMLAFALVRFSAEQSLFPLEVALDLAYWRGLWQETQKLLGEDHRQATRLIGTLIDANNIMWTIRYKIYKQLSEEELINYTLPIGYRVRDTDIRALAAGAEIASVVNRLYPEAGEVLTRGEDVRQDLSRLEAELRRVLATRCMAAFLGNPFHVGLPLAFLILHELEVQDLITMLEAKSTDASAEEFRPFLVRTPVLA